MAACPSASAADREEIAFLDVETSAPPACVLLEFGAIVICSRSLVDVSSYATLVRPADPDAAVPVPTARCNGITRDAVADAPPFRDVADKVYDVLHGRVWAGHNIVKFDSMIIRDAFAEIGRPPPQHKGMIDTLPLLTRCFGPRAGDMKMASLANYFGLGKQRHRSLDDVKMNIDVFKNCATVLFLEASLREVLSVQSLLECAIRNQGTDDPATNRDLSGQLVGSHVEEMVLDTAMQMDAAGSGGFPEFVGLEDVSTESIKISVMLLHPFGPRKIVQHKGAQLQLSCPGLQVRWISTNKFLDNTGRPKLSIVVEIPENLCKVLEFCDDLAQSSSPEACSNSEWKPMIKRYGRENYPTVRLNISTVDSGHNAIYSTRIYQKEPNGVIPKLVSRVDAAELESMLQRNRVDALFSLEIYEYPQNAGIRLVAKRLDVHFKGTRYLHPGVLSPSSELSLLPIYFRTFRMEYAMLKDVNMMSQQWTVRVRLTRFTEFMTSEKPPRFARIDVILLDEQGTAMEGQVPENRIPFFRARVREDCVYEISFFQVCDARMRYRPVNHQFMMRFTQHTTLQEITPVPHGFPKYAFDIVSYDVLRSRAGNRDICSDAIGLFTGCSHVRSQNTRNGVKPLREVYLTNGREDIVVTLWEHHAERFDGEYISTGAQRPLVILFVGVTSLLFNDKISLQSASSCKWYVDPDIPQTEEIKISCGAKIAVPAWAKRNPSQSDPQKSTVYQLSKFTNPHVIYTNRYLTEVKIRGLVGGHPWWYPACKTCRKGTIPNGESVICKGRNCTSTTAAPRYRLAIIAEDPAPPKTDQEPSCIELVIFGPKAQELVGLPVECLITDQAHDEDYIPSQITNLYGKCFELSLSVSPYSLQNPTIIYQVDAIIGAVTYARVSGASTSNEMVTPPAIHDQEVADPNKDNQLSTDYAQDDHLLNDGLDKTADTTVIVTAPVLDAPEEVRDDPQIVIKKAPGHHSGPILASQQQEAGASGSAESGHVQINTSERGAKDDDSLEEPQYPADTTEKTSATAELHADMTPTDVVLTSHEVLETSRGRRKRRVPEKLKDGAEEARDELLGKERSTKRRLDFSGQDKAK